MKTDAFALRHIGPRENDLPKMLKTIGVDSIDQLIYETLPDDIRLKAPLNLDPAMTEFEFANHIQQLVHCLHALSSGDCTRSIGSHFEFPNHGH